MPLGIAPEEMALNGLAITWRNWGNGASASCGQFACDRDVEGSDKGIWERTVYQTGDGAGKGLYPRRGLKPGRPGLSMGIMYQPECYSARGGDTGTDKRCSTLRPASGLPHPREGDNLVSSVKEVIEVTGAAGVPL